MRREDMLVKTGSERGWKTGSKWGGKCKKWIRRRVELLIRMTEHFQLVLTPLSSRLSLLVMLWRKPGTPSRKADNSKVKDDATRDNSEEHSLSARELRISCPAWATSASESSSSNVFTEPQTIVAAVVLTAGTLVTLRIYKNYFKRVPEATKIKEAWLGKRSIFGRVTSVGDGDNFRLFHTPGGRLTGWGWLRRVPVKKAALRSNTVRRLRVKVAIVANDFVDPCPSRRY